VIFRGFEVDGNSMGQTTGGIYVGYLAGKAIHDVTVDQCYVHHTGNPGLVGGNHSITDPNILNETWQPNWQYGIYAAGGDDNTTHTDFYILNNEVSYAYHEGIAIYTAWVRTNPRVDRVVVSRNKVHHCGTRPTYTNANGEYGTAGVGILIANDADNVIVENNNVSENSMIGMWVRTSPEAETGAPNDLIIRYNIVSKSGGAGFTVQNPQYLYINASIYYNLFVNNGTTDEYYGYDFQIDNDTSSSVFNVYNNVFYNTTNVNPFRATVVSNPYTGGSANENFVVNFKNNIIYTGASFVPLYDRYETIIPSNNLIYRVPGSGTTLVWIEPETYYTSANLTTWDANSQSSNPLFVDASNYNFKLQSTSPCISAGADVGLDVDFRGAKVLGTPDIGAYERQVGGTSLFPINFRK
jgi:hypothetical protein